ncbi:hypothetical protein B0T16DRAFT_424640 [Cercophora newfieldiana]|uniref:non-specific serine/threonine protein kinase n=1 Tax=Cercophora newfieldiana TaxID=92897 RepID=A0AA39YNS9_9PEZI|nr:hypothetical protein B0T16DRAFT_424640 [Cercophora newfieldiana]
MEHRSRTVRIPIVRQPLGDATQRVNSATVAAVGRQSCNENNSLRTQKAHARGVSNPLLSSATQPPAERSGNRPQSTPTPAPTPAQVNPRLSAITQGSQQTSDSRRASQFSHASSTSSNRREPKTIIGPWELGKTLGQGSSARVRLGKHRVSQQLVAVKIVAKSTAHLNQAGSLANLDRYDHRKSMTGADGGVRRMPLAIEREVAILKLIQHPNIIQLLDIWENRQEIYIVTEYVEKGDMFGFINWNGRLEEEEAMLYFRQIMSALEYCHSLNICHRDLKPENILLKSNGQVKIADFGMAALHQTSSHQLRTACGSPHYAAPELLRHQYYKGSAVDIWSMGVILFAMLSGRLPFDDEDIPAMLNKAKKAEYKMPRFLTPEAKDLISRILVPQPSHRITMHQMWGHALIKKYNYLDDLHTRDGLPQDVLRNSDIQPVPEYELDAQIMRQMTALWHSVPEQKLKEKLANDEANDQKLFYWLLHSHREAQLENYNNDVPISKSDIHHLKPPNWKKRIATCEFTHSGRNGQGKNVTKFTVISNVPEVDDSGTVYSYDPYNASRNLQPCASQASHAKITVHRNDDEAGTASAGPVVSHSYHSYKTVGSSFRGRRRMNSLKTGTTASRFRSPHSTMSSIRSVRSTPRPAVNPRGKRGVDFSSIRGNGGQRGSRRHSRETLQTPSTNDANGVKACGKGGALVSNPHNDTAESSGIGSHLDKPSKDGELPREESVVWNEELQMLGHRIAEDCDKAFQSSIVVSESSIGQDSREVTPYSISLGTLSTGRLLELSSLDPTPKPRPWDNRPLPPTPPGTITPTSSTWNRGAVNIEPIPLNLRQPSDRRTVSEPLYSLFPKPPRPLPSICEDELARSRVSLNSPKTPIPAVDNQGLMNCGPLDRTIRVVHSPADGPVPVPEPLHVRKVSRNGVLASAIPEPLNVRKISGNSATTTASTDPEAQRRGEEEVTSDRAKARVSSWFRRTSKDDTANSSFATVTEKIALSQDQNEMVEESPSNSADTSQVAAKKKGFRLSFGKWKNPAKNEPRIEMSILDSDLDDITPDTSILSTTKRKRGKKSKTNTESNRASLAIWHDDDGRSSSSTQSARKIEVHQNWLARLFRVKPAMRYLCFTMPKRRARQEIAILLREWRRHGLRDIEVDKNRNIVFARIGPKNYFNMKEVSFAIEIMTVIEHGRRGHLAIARFTQEKGAASSFHKTVDSINRVFASRGLLVNDKRKIGMMIKTLNS